MGRRKLTVDVRAHPRRVYTRKDGTEVSATEVEAHERRMPDRGAPGRTPKAERWYRAEGTLHGWSKSQGPEVRRGHIRESIKKEGLVRTYHKLVGLANVTADRETEKAAREDYNWMLETFPDLKKELTPRKAINKWKGMPPEKRAELMPGGER